MLNSSASLKQQSKQFEHQQIIMQPNLPWFLTRNPQVAKLQWQQERLLSMKHKLIRDRVHLEQCYSL